MHLGTVSGGQVMLYGRGCWRAPGFDQHMTQFGPKLHVFKASRRDMSETDPELTFEHMFANQNAGIRTELVADNNLMIEIDRACEDERPATDDTLAALNLLEWTQFLRECQRRGLRYGFTTYLAFHEMPSQLATLRAARLQRFSDKFGLDWKGETSAEALKGLGRTDMTYDGLDDVGQMLMGLSYGALLLVLAVNKHGSDFSPLGKFRRYLAEYDRLLGIMSAKEIAIARYAFATQRECPGKLDEVRSRIDLNFARNKKRKHPKDLADMCATALNGAFDLRLMTVMNIADTRGVEGTRMDCWLATLDAT